MLRGIFLLICSAAFTLAVPTAEIKITIRNDTIPLKSVLDSDDGPSVDTGDESKKTLSENLSDLFFQTPSNRFYVSKVAKTWDDAAKSCQREGMALASITSQKEQLELFKFLFVNDLVPADDFSGYWLSGHQLENGLYNWTALNEHINCWGWLPGEPSHIDDLEHCVEIKFEARLIRFGWNNFMCTKDRRFICQNRLGDNKDKSLNQQEIAFEGTNEEQETAGYWLSGHQIENGLYNWTSANKHINCWGWLPGEPSHIGDVEHCVELKREAGSVRLGWNNLLCQKYRRFICEQLLISNKDSLPNRPTLTDTERNGEPETKCYFIYRLHRAGLYGYYQDNY